MKYHVFDPTGNITVLAECERDRKVADDLMKTVPDAEQVGFLTDDGLTLTMAGGEFCGNASMCAAALYAERTGRKEIRLRVSGAENEVSVTAEGAAGQYYCTVEMPPVRKIEKSVMTYGGREYALFAVYMQGICHLIVTSPMKKEDAEAAAEKWCADLSSDAVGLMFLNREKQELKPLVYVKTADTLFWESSCASGTSAVGAYLAFTEKRKISEDISEPAGILHVEAAPDGRVKLSGNVKFR